MHIYTKLGDRGETSLPDGRRVPKDEARVAALGGLDELGAAIGLSRAHGLCEELSGRVARVQNELFSAGSQLAAGEASLGTHVPRVSPDWTLALEREIDAATAELPPLHEFILSGGSASGAWLHFARTVCRRAERQIVTLARSEQIDPALLAYLNRLSDWLFTMARLANYRAGTTEPVWRKP